MKIQGMINTNNPPYQDIVDPNCLKIMALDLVGKKIHSSPKGEIGTIISVRQGPVNGEIWFEAQIDDEKIRKEITQSDIANITLAMPKVISKWDELLDIQ